MRDAAALAELEDSRPAQAQALRSILAEQLSVMGQSLVQLYEDRENPVMPPGRSFTRLC